MILVAFALREESAAFRRELERSAWREKVVVCHTGMGATAARMAVAKIGEAQRLSLVISAGFAGALVEGIERGEVVIAANLGHAALAGPANDGKVRGARFGVALGIVETAEERTALHRQTGADVVDMESHAVAEVCRRRRWPFLGVRVISDSMREPFPVPASYLLDPGTGKVPFTKLLAHLAFHPGKWCRFARFVQSTRQGSEKLAQTLMRVLQNAEV